MDTKTGGHAINKAKLRPHEFFWAPEMRPGDVMFFDPLAPHSSCSTSEMTEPRTSVDIRVMPFDVDQTRNFRETPGFGAIVFDDKGMIAPSAILDGKTFEYDSSGASPAVAEAWAKDY